MLPRSILLQEQTTSITNNMLDFAYYVEEVLLEARDHHIHYKSSYRYATCGYGLKRKKRQECVKRR